MKLSGRRLGGNSFEGGVDGGVRQPSHRADADGQNQEPQQGAAQRPTGVEQAR